MRPSFTTCWLLMFLIVQSKLVFSQYRIKHFTTKEGLTQGTVFYFLEDSRGYLWMSSQVGLNRLEGNRFRTFQHQDNEPTSIGKGEVRGIVEAPNGDVWVGTEVCLSRYVRKTGRFQNYYLRGKSKERVLTQCQPFWTDDSTVWFLNDQYGVSRLDYRQNRLTTVLSGISFQYSTITRLVWMDVKNQCIWLRLPQGVMRYEIHTRQRTYYFTNRRDNHTGDSRTIYAIYGYPDGSAVWVSTNRGLVRINKQGIREYTQGNDPENDITYTLTSDHNGRLWAGSTRSGIFVLDTANGQIVQRLQKQAFNAESLMSNHISELYTDRQGLIWANADPKGVELIYPTSFKPAVYEDNPLDSSDFNGAAIRGIVAGRNGTLWVGTIGEGVRHVDPSTRRISRPINDKKLWRTSVRALYYDSRGKLLIGTKLGISIYDEQTKKTTTIPIGASDDKHLSNTVRGICPLADNSFVVATEKGLYIFNIRLGNYTTVDSTSAYSGALYRDTATNRLYAGRLDRDLQCFSVKAKSLEFLYNALLGFNILCFGKSQTQNHSGGLWIGTDNGLIQFDTEKRRMIRHYTQRDGLPNPVIYSLLADSQKNLWLSSDKGLIIFDSKRRFRVLPETVQVEFNSYAAFQSSPHTMYFGSVIGLHVVNPAALQKWFTRSVRFNDLSINESQANLSRTIDELDTLELTYAQGNMALSVSALNYTADYPIQYQYRLKGQHDNWSTGTIGAPIRYTNLAAKTYQLQVRILDSNGKWTPTRSLTVIVISPFWQRLWFILFVLVFGVGVIYKLVQYYVRLKQIAQQSLTKRLIAAQEQERLRIAQDLHDDVGNTLATAKGLLERSLSTEKKNEAQQIGYVQELISKAVTDLRIVTHNLMPIDFTQSSLAEVLEKQILITQRSSHLRVTFILAGEPIKLPAETELTIYRIVCELLQNIRKHAQATQAFVQLIYQPTELVVSVEDNGIGMSNTQEKEKKQQGIGVNNLYSRAEYIKGTLTFQTDTSGVLVLLKVPYGSHIHHSSSHR